jgi:hypothetical protein
MPAHLIPTVDFVLLVNTRIDQLQLELTRVASPTGRASERHAIVGAIAELKTVLSVYGGALRHKRRPCRSARRRRPNKCLSNIDNRCVSCLPLLSVEPRWFSGLCG